MTILSIFQSKHVSFVMGDFILSHKIVNKKNLKMLNCPTFGNIVLTFGGLKSKELSDVLKTFKEITYTAIHIVLNNAK